MKCIISEKAHELETNIFYLVLFKVNVLHLNTIGHSKHFYTFCHLVIHSHIRMRSCCSWPDPQGHWVPQAQAREARDWTTTSDPQPPWVVFVCVLQLACRSASAGNLILLVMLWKVFLSGSVSCYHLSLFYYISIKIGALYKFLMV